MVSAAQKDLWSMVLEDQQLAPADLADAIERQVASGDLDFRTRLLIRDSIAALATAWGEARVTHWLVNSPHTGRLSEIRDDQLGPAGFPSLARRIMEPTRTETILQFLRDLGQRLESPAAITIGGSTALILANLLSRRTEDIDVVDEVPVQIRTQHDLLDELARRYGLLLTHFQSRYLPSSWQSRMHDLGSFARLNVRLVDALDIAVGKLFSLRTKDLDDLRALLPHLGKSAIAQRLAESGGALLKQEPLRDQAEKNWYVLFGEPLPKGSLAK